MISKLCEPEHMVIIILVLLAALIAVGSGRGLGKFIGPLLRRFSGKSAVTINVGEGEMPNADSEKRVPSCPLVDPGKCPSHQAEHERSIKNETNIEKLFVGLSDLKKEIREGNERILLALVAGGHVKAENIPPRK